MIRMDKEMNKDWMDAFRERCLSDETIPSPDGWSQISRKMRHAAIRRHSALTVALLSCLNKCLISYIIKSRCLKLCVGICVVEFYIFLCDIKGLLHGCIIHVSYICYLVTLCICFYQFCNFFCHVLLVIR